MALIICPECNSALFEFAEKCPTCGCDRETIQKLIENKRQDFAEYKKGFEERIKERAEKEWDNYVTAMSGAAEEYNARFKEIEEKYAPTEATLIGYAEKAEQSAAECNETIKTLSEEKDKVGLFNAKARNDLQKKIDDEYAKCRKFRDEINAAAEKLKQKRNAEIDVIAQKLIEAENKEVDRIEQEVDDLTVRGCSSSVDVIWTMITEKYTMGHFLHTMLEKLGILTRSEMLDNLMFSENNSLNYSTEVAMDQILKDQQYCEIIGIGLKQVIDDFYYIALSDSARDQQSLERQRAFDARMAELERQRLELERQLMMSGYGVTPSAPQQAKPASVIKRGVAGAIIGGPAGAIIGAGSAINKNMTQKQ